MLKKGNHIRTRIRQWGSWGFLASSLAGVGCLLGCGGAADKESRASQKETHSVSFVENKPAGISTNPVPAKKDEAQVIRSTFKVQHLERFKPLPPRNNAGTPDLQNKEVQARVAVIQVEREQRRNENIARIVKDRAVAGLWLKRMADGARGDAKVLASLKDLDAKLLPSREAMIGMLKEKKIEVAALSFDSLDRKYRMVFAEELKSKVGQFSNLTEGAGL